MSEKKKSLYDYKIGEVVDENDMGSVMRECLESPVMLVKIGYTFQDSDGVQMETSLVHKDYEEEGDVE